jgi:REP element-mobilizing transposase RayT
MVRAYHVIMSAYGFWLPNDPRGSWSDFIGAWELLRFGRATTVTVRYSLAHHQHDVQARLAAKRKLKYPPVIFNGQQARAIARGFAEYASKSALIVWACSIMPEHVHIVVARHRSMVEQIINHLKGAATHRIIAEGIHPLASHAKPGRRPPKMWARGQWAVYLDDVPAIRRAIRYVDDNPIKEGKRRQGWRFVAPFDG